MPEPGEPLRVVFWGTYDTGKPRTRILLRGLRELGVELLECHTDVWSAVEDKSRIDSRLQQFKLLLACLASYPGLLWRYLRLPPHDAVIVGYPGQLDILLLWPLARLRRTPIVLDLVQSAYLTMVEIRNILPKTGLAARLLFRAERLALHTADRVVFLSRYGAADLGSRFGIPQSKRAAVMIGAEPEIFPPRTATQTPVDKKPFTVLFYGSFHKLHGIDSIVAAAERARSRPFRWLLIGQGREAETIRQRLQDSPNPRLQWIPWVPYPQLVQWLHQADVALGLMGTPKQSGWAIPNKVFQVFSAGVPLITADTPAMRELIAADSVDTVPNDIILVPPGDPDAIVDAVERMYARCRNGVSGPLHRALVEQFQPRHIARQFLAVVEAAVAA